MDREPTVGQSERWRMAALEPYTDAPQTTQEWLRALELGADAAVRVVLEHLKAEFSGSALAGEAGADYGHALSREGEAYNEALQVAWTVVNNLLREVGPDA